MKYYTRTFVGGGVVLGAITAAALLTNALAGQARARFQRLLNDAHAARAQRSTEQERIAEFVRSTRPVRDFAAAWLPFAKLPEKEAAETMRSEMESVAQRQLGLVTDNAITPQPERSLLQGLPRRVQRVTLRASGRDLAALLTWLGKVEEKYPAAWVEQCEFSSNVGGNTGLTIRLVQPLEEAAPRTSLASASLQETALLPEAIAAVPWLQYLPAKVKPALPVGFQRNPLQPAIAGDPRTLPMLRDESDEITPRLERALEGRVRSVIRGPSPLLVVEGRIFRVGDELVIGSTREKPLPEAKTKLKHIGDDQLLFQVSGGSQDRTIQCEAAYPLPPFLKAR